MSPDPLPAIDLCTEITRGHSRSFFFASGLLPPDKRDAARVLYAFCRLSDNIVDEGVADPAAAGRRLDDWRAMLPLPPERQTHPVLQAWAETRLRFRIPLCYSEELLDGMRMDLEQSRYRTFAELWRYCYRAASTVGLCSMHIIGFRAHPDAYRQAEELGVALQLTNILRDVGEDWQRGRVYLPLEDLERFGYGEGDLARGVVDERYRALMQFQVARANALYEGAWPGIAWLHRDGRLAIGVAAGLYRGILHKLAGRGYDNFRQRVYLTRWDKLRLLPGIWWRVRALEG